MQVEIDEIFQAKPHHTWVCDGCGTGYFKAGRCLRFGCYGTVRERVEIGERVKVEGGG